MEIVYAQCNPNFIHEYALSMLKTAGYRLAVCSNSVRQTVLAMLGKANLITYLDLIISNEDVAKTKPDPEMYLRVMEDFALEPDECLIVEDNENGIKAARASGAHVLVVQDVKETNFDNLMVSINAANGFSNLV
jgi:beta-phosphoglucomutase